MPPDEARITRDDTHQRVTVAGKVTLPHYSALRARLEQELGALKGAGEAPGATVALAEGSVLDTAGAMLLYDLVRKRRLAQSIEGLTPAQQALLGMIAQAERDESPPPRPLSQGRRMTERLGKATLALWGSAFELISFMGHTLLALLGVLLRPARLRLGAVTHHLEEVGINAIPIIALIAFLMSVILGYQGLAQLRPLGAEQYTVNLIAVSVLREMSVLLASIMVAGRSGSAFTAEIGVMKGREEIDALHTIGLDAFELLVVPRVLAVLIALPLLTFLADMSGMLGGAIISQTLMNLSWPEYMERFRHVAHTHDFYAGLIKAPVFAFMIGVVGCMHGLKVTGSSESVGRETTASVVQAIFLVLMLDGMFSIFFQKIGL